MEPTGTNAGVVTRRFKPYPAYKDSGVEWLGEIPAHWTAVPFRRLIRRIEQGWSPVAEDRLTGMEEWAVIKLSAVNRGNFLQDEHKGLPADLEPDIRYEIRDGDFLLTRANTPELVGDVCVVHKARRRLMLCDLVYRLQLRSDLVAPAYLAYWLLSRAGRHQIEVDARGSSQSMVKISQGLIRSWTVVLPPLAGQQPIVAFLDRETARIDALVAKKERLIELLQEKRVALITRAVTKGLPSAGSGQGDPNVPMKDSGDEWLGDIPEHWKVKPLKRLASLRAGAAITAESIGESGEFPVFGGNGIRGYTSSYTHVGDFPLIGRQGALCGCVNFASGRFWASEHAVVAAPQAGTHPYWLAYLLCAMSLNSYSESAAQPGLAVDTISVLHVPAPCIAEQRAIAEFLDRGAGKIDALLIRVRDAIDRLRELRTALVSAAVTGKIDVREVER